MKFFDTRKKRTLIVFALIFIVAAVSLVLASCDKGIIWTDKLEKEGDETIDVTSPAISLPNKPDEAPTADKDKPTALGTVSVSNACYTLTNGVEGESLFSVYYDLDEALPAYAYVFVPVVNYDGNPYLKIKADCDSVERLAVLAVYYEQYQDSRPAVAVYNGAVMDGENTIICKLNESTLLDSHYGAKVDMRLYADDRQQPQAGYRRIFGQVYRDGNGYRRRRRPRLKQALRRPVYFGLEGKRGL